jgi:hypothetical protein
MNLSKSDFESLAVCTGRGVFILENLHATVESIACDIISHGMNNWGDSGVNSPPVSIAQSIDAATAMVSIGEEADCWARDYEGHREFHVCQTSRHQPDDPV